MYKAHMYKAQAAVNYIFAYCALCWAKDCFFSQIVVNHKNVDQIYNPSSK